MSRLGTWFLAMAALAGCVTVERPIIAEVVAEPDRYLDRRVELYGVVVKAQSEGRRFYIQDISQRPLLVHAPAGAHVKLNGQYIVVGVLISLDGELAISAEHLIPTRVTAGGGCC